MRWLRRYLINRRLRRTMKPDAAYRARRLAQFDYARRVRYFENVGAIWTGSAWPKIAKARQERDNG